MSFTVLQDEIFS